MRSLFLLMGLMLLGGAAATSLSRTYLPPQLDLNLQDISLPPASVSRNIIGVSGIPQGRVVNRIVQVQPVQQQQLIVQRPQRINIQPVVQRNILTPSVQVLPQPQLIVRPQQIVQRKSISIQPVVQRNILTPSVQVLPQPQVIVRPQQIVQRKSISIQPVVQNRILTQPQVLVQNPQPALRIASQPVRRIVTSTVQLQQPQVVVQRPSIPSQLGLSRTYLPPSSGGY